MHPNAKQGEDLVVQTLIKAGFEILNRNFYWCKHEIDIIAKRKEIIYLFEVKFVTNMEMLKIRSSQINAYDTFIQKYYINENIQVYFAIVNNNKVQFLPMEKD